MRLPLFLTLWLLAGSASATDCVLNVRMDDDPPYLVTQSNGEEAGVHADVTREALRRIGCRAVFHDVPFIRAMKDLAEGKIDIVPDLFRTSEREVFARFSRTRNQVPNRLFIRVEDKGRWTITSFEDLPRLGIKLGLEAGAIASPDYPDLATDPRFRPYITQARTHETLWRMLLAHHIDAVILDEQTGKWEAAHLGFGDQVMPADFIAATAPAHFAFSRATVTEAQVQGFDAAVSEMHKDGTLAAILVKYGLDPAASIDISD